MAPSIGDILKLLSSLYNLFEQWSLPILKDFFYPINNFAHSYLYLPICLLVILYTIIYHRKHFKVELPAVNNFITVMIIVCCFKICWWNLTKSFVSTYGVDIGGLVIVPLEDVFYVMLPYFIANKFKNKHIKLSIWVIFSIFFASGHLYQGLTGFLVTSAYPYFISRYFAEKTSFTTVMICHFLYDCFLYLSFSISNMLLLS